MMRTSAVATFHDSLGPRLAIAKDRGSWMLGVGIVRAFLPAKIVGTCEGQPGWGNMVLDLWHQQRRVYVTFLGWRLSLLFDRVWLQAPPMRVFDLDPMFAGVEWTTARDWTGLIVEAATTYPPALYAPEADDPALD